MPEPLEECICAAIQLTNGEIVKGHRHNNCIIATVDLYGKEAGISAIQGFMTTTGRFVDRKEAMRIQRVCGKPSHYGPYGRYVGEHLFSEDLY